jgi:hypothetical protein
MVCAPFVLFLLSFCLSRAGERGVGAGGECFFFPAAAAAPSEGYVYVAVAAMRQRPWSVLKEWHSKP